MDVIVNYYFSNLHKADTLSNTLSDTITVEVSQMVNSIDDMYKNIVTEDEIKKVKENQECIEVIFPNNISASFSWNKTISFRKVLIVFPAKEGQNAALVYLGGDDAYFSPLYVSSSGLKIANRVKDIIENAESN